MFACLTLCNPMDCSTLGSSVLHYLPKFAQIHVHWVDDTLCTTLQFDICTHYRVVIPKDQVANHLCAFDFLDFFLFPFNSEQSFFRIWVCFCFAFCLFCFVCLSKFHIWVKSYLSFSARFISLRIIFSRFPHIVTKGKLSLFFMTD